MVKINQKVACPKCEGSARVIWVSADGKRVGIKCPNYHIHLTPPPTRWTKPGEGKTKRGVVFLVEAGDVVDLFPNVPEQKHVAR